MLQCNHFNSVYFCSLLILRACAHFFALTRPHHQLNYAAVKATMPNAKPTAVLTAVVLKYKTATEAQKQEIEKLIQTDRQRYEEQLKVYYALKPKRPLNKYAAFVKVQ